MVTRSGVSCARLNSPTPTLLGGLFMQFRASLSRILRRLIPAILGLGVALAQQTIPLTSSSCNPTGPVVSCHWSNSNLTCTYNATDYLTSTYHCTSTRCAGFTEEHGQGTKECMLVTTSHCCALNLEMDSSCSTNLSSTFSVVTTSVPCC